MTQARILFRTIVVALVCLASIAPAAAEENGSTMREAAKHFQRGVTLYSEADYPGALVEFKRAYVLAPNEVVLYNVGQTQYQLRDYAGALGSFERYLSMTGAADPHRSQVESSVKVLRTRVGQLTIVTVPVGAEVSVDDRVIGTTPFAKPVVVGVGHLTVTASAPGRVPVTRYVDLAAEDNVSVTLEMAAQTTATRPRSVVPAAPVGAADAPAPMLPPSEEIPPPPPGDGSSWRRAGWIVTGVSAAGAIGFGLAAKHESNELESARNVYVATHSNLDHLANLTTTFSVIADSLAVVAVVVGGLTLYSTLGAHGTEAGSTQVSVGLASMQLEMTF